MRITQMIAVWIAAMGLAETSVLAALSEAVFVDATCRAKHWETVFTNEVSFRWEWPAAAESATLGIVGMSGSFTTNVTTEVSNVVWSAFAAGVPTAEDIYDLKLTFLDAGHTVVGVQTARLAVVIGAFNETTINTVSNSSAWTRVKTNVVLPYDAAFADIATNAASAQLVIAKVGGVTQTNALTDAAGYIGWKIKNSGWGYGVFDLTLTFPGTTADALTAELTRPMDGTMIRMR